MWAKKVELPDFTGTNPVDWIAKAERFFEEQEIHPCDKLQWAFMSMEGEAMLWFHSWCQEDLYADWESFTKAVISRFGGQKEQPREKLMLGDQELEPSNEEVIREEQVLEVNIDGVEEKFHSELIPVYEKIVDIKVEKTGRGSDKTHREKGMEERGDEEMSVEHSRWKQVNQVEAVTETPEKMKFKQLSEPTTPLERKIKHRSDNPLPPPKPPDLDPFMAVTRDTEVASKIEIEVEKRIKENGSNHPDRPGLFGLGLLSENWPKSNTVCFQGSNLKLLVSFGSSSASSQPDSPVLPPDPPAPPLDPLAPPDPTEPPKLLSLESQERTDLTKIPPEPPDLFLSAMPSSGNLPIALLFTKEMNPAPMDLLRSSHSPSAPSVLHSSPHKAFPPSDLHRQGDIKSSPSKSNTIHVKHSQPVTARHVFQSEPATPSNLHCGGHQLSPTRLNSTHPVSDLMGLAHTKFSLLGEVFNWAGLKLLAWVSLNESIWTQELNSSGPIPHQACLSSAELVG